MGNTVGPCRNEARQLQIELRKALQKVRLPPSRSILGTSLRGPFKSPTITSSLAVVFGEPLSLYWLLPMRPGGSGDPLCPEIASSDACEPWADLATFLTRCGSKEMWAKQHKAADQWSQRAKKLIAAADAKSAG